MMSCRQGWFFDVSSFEPAMRNLVPSTHINRQHSGRPVELIAGSAQMQSQLAKVRSKVQCRLRARFPASTASIGEHSLDFIHAPMLGADSYRKYCRDCNR